MVSSPRIVRQLAGYSLTARTIRRVLRSQLSLRRRGAALATAIAQRTAQVAVPLTAVVCTSHPDDLFRDPRMHH
jgi:hypothetical protein